MIISNQLFKLMIRIGFMRAASSKPTTTALIPYNPAFIYGLPRMLSQKGMTARTNKIAGRNMMIRQNMPDIQAGKPVGIITPK